MTGQPTTFSLSAYFSSRPFLQVVEHLRQVYSDIAAAKEAKESGEETPPEPGEDDEEEVGDGHDPDDL